MLLMEEAERIAMEEHGSVKISVISGRNIQYTFVLITLLYILFK
jgi:histone acetyltransferase (RNA polymerase elongator complex component)